MPLGAQAFRVGGQARPVVVGAAEASVANFERKARVDEHVVCVESINIEVLAPDRRPARRLAGVLGADVGVVVLGLGQQLPERDLLVFCSWRDAFGASECRRGAVLICLLRRTHQAHRGNPVMWPGDVAEQTEPRKNNDKKA